ncbi:MAG: GNAT family N-acetyltransferase [Actinomycetota bacterium]
MYRLAVHPERRRGGVALMLVRAGEDRLREAGCVRVTALVPHADEAARGLWEAAGYAHDELVQRFVRNV